MLPGLNPKNFDEEGGGGPETIEAASTILDPPPETKTFRHNSFFLGILRLCIRSAYKEMGGVVHLSLDGSPVTK